MKIAIKFLLCGCFVLLTGCASNSGIKISLNNTPIGSVTLYNNNTPLGVFIKDIIAKMETSNDSYKEQ